MNVLATRGAGYVDSHAAKLLAAEGHEIWVYDNLVFEHTRLDALLEPQHSGDLSTVLRGS